MATANDVAAYVLGRLGSMSTMKLQKLLYYSQAWHLVWEDRPLFPEKIEAWANGPVVYEVFDGHRGQFTVAPPWPRGDQERLTSSERETVDAVIEAYGHLTGRQLSQLTHAEDPWRRARAGLPPTARSNTELTHAVLADYYGALDLADEAQPIEAINWSADPAQS